MTDLEKIADALECFWNASIGEAHHRQDSTCFAVIACINEGINAVVYRLRENAQPTVNRQLVLEEAIQRALACTTQAVVKYGNMPMPRPEAVIVYGGGNPTEILRTALYGDPQT